MRSNIRDIMAACECSEQNAEEIERRINDDWLLDWSECTMPELFKTARQVDAEWKAEDDWDGRA